MHHNPLPYRSIQVGLSGDVVARYLDRWVLAIIDLTDQVSDIRQALRDCRDVKDMPPRESPYPLPEELAQAIRATITADPA
ncbi:DUF4291 family protein [Sphaerisporangium sp. NPDC051017]|uniref:DUF4291 family protein n=1 Tax=Sphaerisporangium sp. NPDC051017 TaxID=3154636 RepID=UPI003444B2F8